MELLFAGYHTTASSACTLVIQLGKYPNVTEKLREALESETCPISPGYSRSMSRVKASDISRFLLSKPKQFSTEGKLPCLPEDSPSTATKAPTMFLKQQSVIDGPYSESLRYHKYLDNVLKEVLRIAPPIGGGYRKVLQSFELNVSVICRLF